MRYLARLTMTCWLAATVGLTIWTLSQNPFLKPMVERTAEELRAAYESAMAREVTPDWLRPRLEDAIAADDTDRVRLLLGMADDNHVVLPVGERTRAEELIARHDGVMATVADCGSCAIDVGSCRTIALISACAVPFELSPAGDVAALGRAGYQWMTDGQVDGIEAGLAVIGLGATAAAVATGGTSATVKVGATLLRIGRRIGAIHPALLSVIRRAAVHAGDEAELTSLIADFGRLKHSTSTAEALVLLRNADSPADLTRLVRVSEAAGPETRKVFEALGKARAFRMLNRVSHLAVLAVGLLSVVATQIAALLVALVRWVLRPLAQPARRRRPVA